MIDHSPALDQLGVALAKAQAAVKGAKKDSANPFFKSAYADLASVWEACREALTENGLSVVQFPGGVENNTVALTTMLVHSSGQWIKGTAQAPLAKLDAQSVGSATTYLRRFALAAVAGVTPEDDDGNAATGRSAPARKAQPTPPPVQTQPLTEKPLALQQDEPDELPPGTRIVTWPFAKNEHGALRKGVGIDGTTPVEDLRWGIQFIELYMASPRFKTLAEKKGIGAVNELHAIQAHLENLLDATRGVA